MQNIAVTFRQEITRLARREIRSVTRVLRKASAQFRRDIAELKRQAAERKSEMARLQRRMGKSIEPAFAGAESASVRYSARSVISQRNRLGLSAADFGRLVGVTGHTVYTWEHGSTRPRLAQINRLASVRSLRKTEARARLEELRKKVPAKRRVARR